MASGNIIALIGPTGYGSFGIVWRNFPYMERRGGYSGPFDSLDEARDRAQLIAEHYDGRDVTFETVENVNELDDRDPQKRPVKEFRYA